MTLQKRQRTAEQAGFSPLNPHESQNKTTLIDNINTNLNNILSLTQTIVTAAQSNNNEILNSVLSAISVVIDTCKTQLTALKLQQQPEEDPFERRERERSLVLIGLPESTSEHSTERVRSDFGEATRVLNELGVECSPTTVYRMGRRNLANQGHGRLLKVVLPARVFRSVALGSWKTHRAEMRKDPKWNKLLIRPSLTKAERDKEKEMWQQRNEDRTRRNSNSNDPNSRIQSLPKN
uniref:Uncharacterized protein n=1 Tax=Globodera rostochiensis TaxID=31243 RepID=A0A914I344_GLORO